LFSSTNALDFLPHNLIPVLIIFIEVIFGNGWKNICNFYLWHILSSMCLKEIIWLFFPFLFLSVFEFENTVSHSDQIFPPDSLQNGRLQQFSSYFIPNEICDCPVSQG
jgi:hypothetical protein